MVILSVENSPTEAFFVEISLRKKMVIQLLLQSKWKKHKKITFETLSKNLALHLSSYGNLIIIGDFNVCVEDIGMSGF